MAGNKNLNSAAKAKKDEFYTQLGDIENELSHYRKHFDGKIVLCNCDDPFESQFFFYFAMNFNFLKLKKLIVTSYTGSPVQGDLFDPVDDAKPAYNVQINRIDKDPLDWQGVTEMMYELKAALGKNKSATVNGNTLSLLTGDGNFCAGDFRSKECVQFLWQADIVVTNPPFSLFREYVKQLVDNDKKFIIIGNQNAITYKEIFPLIMQNKIWLGYGFRGNVGFFNSHYEDTATASEHREGMIRVSGVNWFTNLDIDKRNRPYDLVGSYKDNPEMYPRYDNYDAIEVSKTADIPEDYFGVMGVPITFLDKYCPAQFEILGIANSARWIGYECYTIINGRRVYNRLLIRRRANENEHES